MLFRSCRRGGRGPNCGRDGSFLGLKRSHCFENQNTTPLGARPAPGSFNCPPPSWENCRLLRAWSGHDRDRVGLAGTQALPSAPTHRRARRPRHPVGRVQLRARSPPFGKGEALRGMRAGSYFPYEGSNPCPLQGKCSLNRWTTRGDRKSTRLNSSH